MVLSHSIILVILCLLLPSHAYAFLQQPNAFTANIRSSSSSSSSASTSCKFMMSTPSSDDDDRGYNDKDDSNSIDNDDESIDPDSLGDWRTFRMNLANSDYSSLSSTTFLSSYSESSIDGMEIETADAKKIVASPSSSSTSSSSRRPKSVSEENERLLSAQNSALAHEYTNGAWAHESPIPEVGGLVCRMPLEVEIYRGRGVSSDSSMHGKLMALLESGKDDKEEEADSSAGRTQSASFGGSSRIPMSLDELDVPSTDVDGDDDDSSSDFSVLAAKTIYWYRTAEKLLQHELLQIMSSSVDANNGKIDPRKLSAENLEFLRLYVDHQSSWQEVGLVIERDERSGNCKTVTINRPMAFRLTKNLGRLILLGGAPYQEKGGVVVAAESNGNETQNIVKFLSAFENECGVYVGGPDDVNKPAVMIHGIPDLPGSVEISPGTGIYRGGLEAAMDGVLAGRYQPLDFRFFIGQRKFVGRQLEEAIRLGKYQPVACSRPLVLKQCLQLPKPLWHEVLEFCGGELKQISKLELSKRDDLK